MRRVDPPISNRIVHCDCAVGLARLPDACIPLTITSPPFDGLRDYGGDPFDFAAIAPELHRVTMPGGVLVWVVQDQIISGEESGTSLRQKQIFRELSFRNNATLILVCNHRPIPQRGRYACNWQYGFVLSKGRPRHVHVIKDRPNSTAGDALRGNVRLKNGRIIKRGQTGGAIGQYVTRTNIWSYEVGGQETTRDRYAFAHPALMPESMAEDLVLSFSRPGDLVLDPFCGEATTCKMALLHDRRFLGPEAHEQYLGTAGRRLREAGEEHVSRLDAALELPPVG